MKSADESAKAYLEGRVLMLLLAAVSLALGWILLPFYGTILWGAIIALLFAPFTVGCCGASAGGARWRHC